MVGIPGDRIRSFIERVEHIDEEIKALTKGRRKSWRKPRAKASM
jgi:hypothetical protein